ncbi:hypothetical protein ACFVFS_20165 [Kitasatospora sp. NPDC057692]|uniref:hypothetical protein n=1 Tax=Kitasatospora sp. NPDC057692 TaxID=3346215 RepID=UPI0036AAE007
MADKRPEDAAETIRNHASDVEVGGDLNQIGQVNVHLTQPERIPEVPVVVTLTWHSNYSVEVGEGREEEWLIGGAPILEVLVEGRSAHAAVLKELRPVVLSRRPPRPLRYGLAVMSAVPLRPFDVDLDAKVPKLRPHGVDFPFKVSRDDPEQFAIRWLSTRDEVRWFLELHWVCDGRSGIVRIPEEGSYCLYPSGGSRRSALRRLRSQFTRGGPRRR